ncbi:UvrB/UvrC motif-containing protein [uncultured Treponema sp.]
MNRIFSCESKNPGRDFWFGEYEQAAAVRDQIQEIERTYGNGK